MSKFYYALVFCLFGAFISQVQAQTLGLSDLSAMNWKPLSESITLVDGIIVQSSDKAISEPSSSLLVKSSTSNRTIIATSIKSQLNQQSDVAQALYTGYNDAMTGIRQQPGFEDSVEQMCEKDFEYILSILKQ